MLDALLRSAGELAPVSLGAALEYSEQLDLMREKVDRELAANPHLAVLIGSNPVTLMYDNHRNHAQFMANVLRFNAFEMLARVAVWVYKSYHAHGFAYDYFPVELQAWQRAVTSHLGPAAAQEINRIYQWLLDKHTMFMALAGQDLGIIHELDIAREPERERFLTALLHGDWRQCLDQAQEAVRTPKDLQEFYLQVIQACMYRVGELWERREVSVAQEHLASAIVARVMATVYPQVMPVGMDKGKALVTAAPNEFHETGARMLADCLELDGWEVDYLGANTPRTDFLEFLSQGHPFLAAISITMPFNLDRVVDLIHALKQNPDLQRIRVLVGGRLFHDFPDLWRVTGADGWAPDSKAAVAMAREWWEQRGQQEG